MKPLLSIDVGNTNTGYVIFKDFASKKIQQKGSVYTKDILNGKGDFFLGILRQLKIKPYIVLSSVVPAATNLLFGLLKKQSKKFLIIKPRNIDTIVCIGNKRTGADRISTMAGAYSIYKTDVAIVDFGTATTVSVVDKKANFIAGAILPGLELMLKCLHQNTAQLPKVKIRKIEKKTTIDTASSILYGVISGTAGAVERIIKDIEKENKFVLKLILTGGMADIMSKKIRLKHDVNSMLVFEGMRNIFLRNLDE